MQIVIDYQDLYGVNLARSKETSRYAISGVLFAKNGDMVATDGHRLHLCRQAFEVPEGFEGAIIEFNSLRKSAGSPDGKAMIELHNDYAVMTVNKVTEKKYHTPKIVKTIFAGKYIDNQFPAYQDVIPDYSDVIWEDLKRIQINPSYHKDAINFVYPGKTHALLLGKEFNQVSVMANEKKIALVMPIGGHDFNTYYKNTMEAMTTTFKSPKKKPVKKKSRNKK